MYVCVCVLCEERREHKVIFGLTVDTFILAPIIVPSFLRPPRRVKENAAAINALFNSKSVQLIPVTETPLRVRVQTKYVMGEAEIAVIVVACLIFLGSFVAIILTFRAWRK